MISLLQKRKSEESQEHQSPEKKSRANPVKTTATVKRITGARKPAATKPQTSRRR